MKKKISKRIVLNSLTLIVGLGTLALGSPIALGVGAIKVITISVAGANIILQRYFNQDKQVNQINNENKTNI
jgi:hypothetical protein